MENMVNSVIVNTLKLILTSSTLMLLLFNNIVVQDWQLPLIQATYPSLVARQMGLDGFGLAAPISPSGA